MTPNRDYATLCQHHLTAARYERIRAAWFRQARNRTEATRCSLLASDHDHAAREARIAQSRSQITLLVAAGKEAG